MPSNGNVILFVHYHLHAGNGMLHFAFYLYLIHHQANNTGFSKTKLELETYKSEWLHMNKCKGDCLHAYKCMVFRDSH
jgi:hypothetical protein